MSDPRVTDEVVQSGCREGRSVFLDLRDARAERDAIAKEADKLSDRFSNEVSMALALEAERDAALEALRACMATFIALDGDGGLNISEFGELERWTLHSTELALGRTIEPFDGDAAAAQALVERVVKEECRKCHGDGTVWDIDPSLAPSSMVPCPDCGGVERVVKEVKLLGRRRRVR